MLEKLIDAWPYWGLSIFAVLSGQIGRLGQRAEKGHKLTRARLFIEMSMMPALGSIVGAIAADRDLPIWQILMLGVAAGWAGFGALQLIHSIVMDVLRHLVDRKGGGSQ